LRVREIADKTLVVADNCGFSATTNVSSATSHTGNGISERFLTMHGGFFADFLLFFRGISVCGVS